ncbi:unnamed protein product [Cuscuta epithymum]|uniref:Uncharacterized protein ycf33 n=1 Tax=Cuscuta epithymum TaxID=186058 RepID=A0AAV0FLX8_9ASTE|nr:unnamed protein product [Cuscuta epithymum]
MRPLTTQVHSKHPNFNSLSSAYPFPIQIKSISGAKCTRMKPSSFPVIPNVTNLPSVKSQLVKSRNTQIKKTYAESSRNHKLLSEDSQKLSRNEFCVSESMRSNEKRSKVLIWGAVSMGVVMFLMGLGDEKALALGPEGPLMEEFWDNMRRYAIYVLTVSSGALYIVFQPVIELLKSPITAILIVAIIGGSVYIVSQVLSAMVGISDFNYGYSY